MTEPPVPFPRASPDTRTVRLPEGESLQGLATVAAATGWCVLLVLRGSDGLSVVLGRE